MWYGSELEGFGGVLNWCGLSLSGSDVGVNVQRCGLSLTRNCFEADYTMGC